MKRAFTLMEVNLAILVMAGGILSIVGLYSLGFRENRQSTEDVASAAYADAVLSPLVMALSATNVTWQQFKKIQNYPQGGNGWGEYLDSDGRVKSGINPQGAYEYVRSAVGSPDGVLKWPAGADGGLTAGIVIRRDERKSPTVVRLAFRASKLPAMLLSAPMFYTEVRFQGTVNEGTSAQ